MISNKLKFKVLILGIVYAMLSGQGLLFAQCPGTGCTWQIFGPNTGNYTVNAGQTLCLQSGANMSGTITMNGGTLINCSWQYQTFTLNYNVNAGQSYVENHGQFYLSSSSNMNDVLIKNYGIFSVNGSKTMNAGTQIENYGNFSFSGSLNLGSDPSVQVDNYGTFDLGNTITINASSQLNNYETGILNTVHYTSNSTWYNEGTINVSGNFKNQSGSVGTIHGGCIHVVAQFTNNDTINGTKCGTITVDNTSTNNAVLSGTFAFVDLTPPGAPPYIDSNSGTVGGGITWSGCGCYGTVVPEVCGSATDEDGDCLADCADQNCGVSMLERTIDEEIQFAIRQASFTSSFWGASDSTLRYPRDIAQDPVSGKVFVADYGNNRVLRWASVDNFLYGGKAEAVLGQPNFTSNNDTATSTGMDGPNSLAFDSIGTLWVADGSNSRVLRFDNAASKASGAAADGVLGQPNFTSSTFSISQNGLGFTNHVYIDPTGTLWVTDRQRILRYDNPSSKPNGANADAVLGQKDFTSGSFAVTNHNVWFPQGMVMICNRFYVADGANNRIVWWDNPSSKANGAFMDGVIGQSNYFNDMLGVAKDSLESPSALMTDEEGRLYVADSWNFRLLILNEPLTESFMTDFDVVLGQPDFDSKLWGVSRTRSTFIAGSAILVDGDRKYFASTDVTANRVIVWGPQNLITDEDQDTSSVLIGSDPSGAGGLTFTVIAQPTIGTVTIDDPSTGAFTYHAPGVCGVNVDTTVAFQYSVSNVNGCSKNGELLIRVRDTGPCSEICNDSLDNDGDGLTDCDDPDCGVSTIGYNNGQRASLLYGQPDFTTGAWGVSDSSFFTPSSITIDPATGKVFLAEASNHRVLRFASVETLIHNGKAEAVFGQSNFSNRTAGLAQNRMESPSGLAFDSLGNLFVADNGNERVLRFDNASSKSTGANADGVLGKPNFTTGGAIHSQTGLGEPADLIVDANGNLWVSDFNNYRVVRYDSAASKSNGAPADAVLGNPDFTTPLSTCTDSTLSTTGGLVIMDGSLYVADKINRRVLIWDNALTKNNGAVADRVLGQPDFITNSLTVTQTSTPAPQMLSNDNAGNLYVGANHPYHRVTIFNNAANKSTGAAADHVIGQVDFTSSGGGTTDSTLYTPRDLLIVKSGDTTFTVLLDSWNNRILFYNQTISTDEMTAISDTLNGVDLAASGSLTFAVVQQPVLGTVTIDNSSLGTYTYTPTGPCMLNKDSVLAFTYSVENGNGCIEIETLNILVRNDSTCEEICGNTLDDDGDGLIDCADSTDCVPDVPGVITTSNDTICEGSTGEAYSIAVVAGATSYDWTVPSGATITAGQGTTSISVDWGSASGNVCVRSYNGFCYSDYSCSYITVNAPPANPSSIFH